MGRLLHRLLGLVATLQVLVAQAPRVPALQVQGGLLQGAVRQVAPGSIILQAHPGAADRDVVGETTTQTLLWTSTTGAGGGMEVVAAGGSPTQEEDTSPHSAATLQRGGTGGGGGSEQLASRMVTSGSGGTEEAGGGGDGGGAGSRTSHDEHRNVTTPNAPRRRPGRSPGAPSALRGVGGGSSTPPLPSPIPQQDGAMAARSAPNQYSNNNVGSTTTISTPPPPEDTLRPAHDFAAMPPPEVNVNDAPTETVDLAVDVDTSRLSSSSEEDKDTSIMLPEPTLAPSITRHYYTFPPRLRPNLAYFGFIAYDTTPGYHGNSDHARHLQGRDTTVWIAILSVACFLAGFMIATIVCYAVYRRKWRPAPNLHPEEDLPASDDLDDLLNSSDNILTDDPADGGVNSSSAAARSDSTEQLLPVVTGSTDLELLTCSQTSLLQCDFLSDDMHVHEYCPEGGEMPILHRHPTAQDRHLQQQGAGDEHLSNQRRSSRGGSTSTCSRSSCSTCSTVLTLDSPGLAEEGGLRRSSNGSAAEDCPGGVSWGRSSRHGSVSTDNGYFTPGGCSLVDWTSET